MSRDRMYCRIGRGETYTLGVNYSHHTTDDRPSFAWIIRDGLGGTVDRSGDDDQIRLGVGDKVDAKAAMGSFVSFLLAAAEAGSDSENAGLFCPATMDWADQMESELQVLGAELDGGIGL